MCDTGSTGRGCVHVRLTAEKRVRDTPELSRPHVTVLLLRGGDAPPMPLLPTSSARGLSRSRSAHTSCRPAAGCSPSSDESLASPRSVRPRTTPIEDVPSEQLGVSRMEPPRRLVPRSPRGQERPVHGLRPPCGENCLTHPFVCRMPLNLHGHTHEMSSVCVYPRAAPSLQAAFPARVSRMSGFASWPSGVKFMQYHPRSPHARRGPL
jgi:hypothetical protein